MATSVSKRRRWSPLTCLAPAALSPSGLITLESNDGEVETLVRTNVELRYAGSGSLPLPPSPSASGASNIATQTAPWNAIDTRLSCHVTTHRIVLIDDEGIGGSIPYALVQAVQSTGGPSFRSPRSSYKIELSTHAWGDLTIVFRGGDFSSYTQSSKDRDDSLNAIQSALKRKAWEDKERQAMKEALRPSTAIASRKVGVDAILTKNQMRHRENASLADAAFGGNSTGALHKKNSGSNVEDINAFMSEATELIKVIEKYAATLERERSASSSRGAIAPSASSKGEQETTKLIGMLENMGMTSALSAKQSGSMYHKQLARQLADFLHQTDKLSKAGGMMTLTDVYCLFNRARGTNMISPEDLLKALNLMKEMNLGMSKRSFASGVVVIQDDAFDDENMATKLAELATSSIKPPHATNNEFVALDGERVGGITVMDVSRSIKMSALLANEHLLSAEQMGLLCRDTTIEGIRFFPNLFNSGDYSLYSKC
eukprot:g6718.t1 g6718   contig23:1084729-1086186(+)